MSWYSSWTSAALWPTLDDSTARAFTASYGLLLLGTLLWTLPQWRRFFVSERWGGYAQSSPETDLLHHPVVAWIGFALWVGAAALLVLGRYTLPAALVNVLLSRHAFVRMRWRGVLRGMGAPGFMSYWIGGAVLLLEYARHHAPTLLPLALLVLQVDYALIMLSSGVYKATAGYPQNDGMEQGMVNPEWGYWWWLFQRLPPRHPIFWFLNQSAWSVQILAAVLMLIPATRLLGALMIMGSFLFIATQIRLGLLCEMVIVCGLLFFHPGSAPATWIGAWMPAASLAEVQPWPLTTSALRIGLWAYLILLPLAHAGLFFNFYGRRSLPRALQRAFEAYTNFFGIIIWRVFSVDVTNFFINIHQQDRTDGRRTLLSHYGVQNGLRYAHVGEAITVTSLFTTLKYYPSNNQLFVDRLLRYARTVPCPADAVLVFEYLSIVKQPNRFDHVPVAEYLVDLAAGTVEERVLDSDALLRRGHAHSPIHEGVRPGSYVAIGG